MASENPTLIDFAKSDFGPVAVDAAKLLVDAAVFAYSPADLGMPASLKHINTSILLRLWNAFSPYLLCDDDKRVVEILVHGYASKYRSYPDVAPCTKDELKWVAEGRREGS